MTGQDLNNLIYRLRDENNCNARKDMIEAAETLEVLFTSLADVTNRLADYEAMEPAKSLTGKELAEIACVLNLYKQYQNLGTVLYS